jgi:hypothetical protein
MKYDILRFVTNNCAVTGVSQNEVEQWCSEHDYVWLKDRNHIVGDTTVVFCVPFWLYMRRPDLHSDNIFSKN